MGTINNTKSIYNCSKCKLNILSNTDIDECIYCGNKLVKLFDNKKTSYDFVIPFKNDKKSVLKIFKKFFKRKNLSPKEFTSKKYWMKIEKIYIPIYMYSYSTSGEIDYECKKISKFSGNGNKYTKTDDYMITIGAKMDFSNVPIYVSNKITEEIFDKIELDKVELSNQMDLSDLLIEDVDINNVDELAENKIKKMIINKLSSEIKEYDFINAKTDLINFKIKSKKSILVPFWIFKTKYKNKIYNIYMCDINKKIFGKIPLSIKKLIFDLIIILIILFTFFYILFTYVVVL